MSKISVMAAVSMLAVSLGAAACSSPQVTANGASDQGSDMQTTTHDLAKWSAGPDNTSP